MTAGTPREWSPANVGRAYWLPPLGRGNGFDAPAWAPIADVPHELVDHLLEALATEEVPAFAGRADQRAAGRSWRVWVGSRRFSTAQDVLRRELGRARNATTTSVDGSVGPKATPGRDEV